VAKYRVDDTLTGINRGDIVRCTAEFENADGLLTDPTTVDAEVQAPDGTRTTPAAANSATGVWYVDVPCDRSGEWYVRLTGSGSVAKAFLGLLIVDADPFEG
jgi:hypothetical protein